jgi:hypothetical protein
MAQEMNVAEDNNVEQSPTDGLNDAQSRRRFLRAAVIGATGMAGAAGVAGLALARSSANSPAIVSHHIFVEQIHSKP